MIMYYRGIIRFCEKTASIFLLHLIIRNSEEEKWGLFLNFIHCEEIILNHGAWTLSKFVLDGSVLLYHTTAQMKNGKRL